MQEQIELRVNEEFAFRVFSPTEGIRLNDRIRKVTIAPTDDRIPAMLSVQAELRTREQWLFLGWSRRRRYRAAELAVARFLTLDVAPSHRLSGDEAGTVYDESTACPVCGAGRRQVGPLRLRLGQLPRLKDVVRSSTGEWIVSAHFVDAFQSIGASGADFNPIEFRQTRRGATTSWYQLVVAGASARIASETVLGIGPFANPVDDAAYVCPLGDTHGFNRLSELHISVGHDTNMDVMLTHEYIGARGGMFVPRRELVLSAPTWSGLLAAHVRGLSVEVARVVAVGAA